MSNPYINGICIWKTAQIWKPQPKLYTNRNHINHPPKILFFLPRAKTTLQTSQKNADPLAESFAGVFFLRLSGVDDGNIQFMEKMFPINTSVRGVRIRFKKNAKTPGILQSIGCFFSNKNCGRMMRFLSFNCIVRSWEWWFLLISTQKTDGAMFQWIT